MSPDQFFRYLQIGQNNIDEWKSQWESFEPDETLLVPEDRIQNALEEFSYRLRNNYPFFHPRYAGQMLKPPHPAAQLAYTLAMQINPNNHALDGGPATAAMEIESVAQIASMFGLPQHLGHLTSSGTIANLEALWVARSIHPDKSIAFSSFAHYTHKRMCEVIGASSVEIIGENNGRIDVTALETELKKGDIGTVVITLGTTSLGSIDPVDLILPLCRTYGVRVHVDAAYGGFFTILAGAENPLVNPAPFLALRNADSIVVDPHKHGLQPYGCGCVLFSDISAGKFYKHDSPYTYFTSKDLHLGEISLECSRPGASAAALWLTLRCLPLEVDTGFGPILAKTRSAALNAAQLVRSSRSLQLFTEPQLDIITYLPVSEPFNTETVSRRSAELFNRAMKRRERPLFLALLSILSSHLHYQFRNFFSDNISTTILRSVLMKPEHEKFVPQFIEELEELSDSIL